MLADPLQQNETSVAGVESVAPGVLKQPLSLMNNAAGTLLLAVVTWLTLSTHLWLMTKHYLCQHPMLPSAVHRARCLGE